MSINRWPEFTFVFIVCLVDFVWKYRFGGERFPIMDMTTDFRWNWYPKNRLIFNCAGEPTHAITTSLI